MILLLFLAVCFLAYSNGANDNFKGVASLFGSRTCSYRTAITWATATTFAGSIAAAFLAQALLKKFSGKGLVPDALTTSPQFLLSVGAAAGVTVILATLLGFPISTTHGLTGALVGAGFVAAGSQVNLAALGKSFLLPLLLSPVLAVGVGALIYLFFRLARLRFGITKEMCVCVGTERQVIPMLQPAGVFVAQSLPTPSATVAEQETCTQQYVGSFIGFNAGRLLDAFHFTSAGAVGFARGLNDAPKIAALLMVVSVFDARSAIGAVAIAMALGGLLNARKVAATMSHRLTEMNSGQGFSANLATSLLVTTASYHGLPVSTTHVSVGALVGIGITTRQVKWKPVFKVLLSWIITLPCAAILAALIYLLAQHLR
jgi:PiT family inorganic phosphate transporter